MMSFNNSTFLPLFPSSMHSFCNCCPSPSLFSNFPSVLQSSFMSDVPLVFAPSPVPSMIPSSPTTSSSSSSNSNKRSSIILPLRSVSFDLSSLVVTARWRREQLGEYIECAFCKANGESYDIYSSHRLRDNEKMITLCPILRAHKCPRCQVSGDQAHTMKYCPIKAEIKANRRMREIELAMKKN
ncbi:unnamed protein product [Rotaria socialis]|uniref:Nanos-type domain-containing protein n=3 Tax=Rotaria socialis TaxID=392032 RepID=A0A817YV90_9BILA|nr:unnamed protein product [Rotaria socialis]CAF3411256.1 unnamed protein product [Rotaria socialis]CAF3577713.1 unnamed protein product [Rotaria socialis]CAF4269242.1 unnamed protein product [Rotaria socialis]CAF4862975.1 unnamed protein product [Rotaria socialis]